jgi:hypothetical protein
VREKPTKPSGYEKPIFAQLPKLKIKYKKIVCWYLLVAFVTTTIVLRYLDEIDKSLESCIILAVSIVTLQGFFEAFWRTYEEAVKDKEGT